MRILLLGAGGFIGRHLLADMLAAGHDVIGVARSTGSLAEAFPEARFVSIDLARALRADDWNRHVAGVDVIGTDLCSIRIRLLNIVGHEVLHRLGGELADERWPRFS